MSSTALSKAVVIGAGISGLATAALLAREGYEVTVLEKQEHIGGRAGLWCKDGFRFDTGPSWYLMPEVFDHFFRLLGTSAEEQLDLLTLNPGYRVFFHNDTHPVDIHADREENLDLFEALEPGSGVRMAGYLDSSAETYQLAKKYFLYSTFHSVRSLFVWPVLSRLPRLLRLLCESLDSFVGRTVKDRRLQQILGYPAVFLGTSPYAAPSMYHLMSHLDLEDGVRYPRGGLTTVIDSVAACAVAEGVRVVTGACVKRILIAEQGRATGVEYLSSSGETCALEADLVVSAADLQHTELALLPREAQTYPEKYWNKKVAGPSAVLLYLGVSGEVPQLKHHTLFFTATWKEDFKKIFGRVRFGPKSATSVPSPASLYVCRPSATDDTVAPAGCENIFVLVPVPADPGIGRGGENGSGDPMVEHIADQAITEIAEWANIPDFASRITVRRTVGPADFVSDFNSWNGTALGPAHILSQSAFFRTGQASKKVNNLYYAGGSTIPGIGLPMCLISAELIIKRLRGDTSTTALPEPLA